MRSKLIIVLLTLTLIFGLFTSKTVKAEDDIEEPIVTEEVVETQTNEEEQPKINPKTKAEKWFETNLGWLVGIPIGTLLTTLIELLYLAKKSKEKFAELKQTKEFNAFAKEQLELGKQMFDKGIVLIDACNESIKLIGNQVEDISKRLDNTDALVIETKNTFDTLNGIIEANKVEIERLQQSHLLIATHTKELVANSTAEEIVKLVKGE